jgi:NAD(P)-dependent dehydrogenase (short-subunit alcohol dehydrogenase family)
MTECAALVTHGAGRIGRAISLALHRSGYAVAIHARRAREAETLRDEIVRVGGRACVASAELADHATDLVKAAAEALGPLSLLVNVPPSIEPDETGAGDAARFDRHMAANLRAPLFLSQAFAAQAAGDGASIVTILDQRAPAIAARVTADALAQTALHAAIPALARALAPKVRVNAVSVGSESDPEEIAAAVVYLSSARSVTGVTLGVGSVAE